MNSSGVLSVFFRPFDAFSDSGAILNVLNGSLLNRPKVSVETCLSLPLSEVINWPTNGSPRDQKPCKSLLISHAFSLSPDHSRLIPKEWLNGQRQPSHSRNRARKLIRLLLTGQLTLHPLFARLCLPGSALAVDFMSLSDIYGQLVHPWLDPNFDTILPRTFRKHHQKILQQSRENQFSNILRPASFWLRFWNLSILLQIRTPWYRLLQHKFPCASRMHKLIESSFFP